CEILNPNNCDTATVSVTVTAAAIVAVDDAGTAVNGFTGGTAFTNVLANDTLNNAPVVADQVNTTFVSATNDGITLSGTDVLVAAGTPAGTYDLVYQICEILNPNNCDTATVSVTVTAAAIVAVDDAGTAVNGFTGGTAFTNVLTNDTLNNAPVVADQVNTTFVSATNDGITLSGTDVLVAAGTPAGTYDLVYQICEILNPTNCDTATVSVTVTAAVIDALADTNAIPVNGTTGGNSGVNVLTNDTLNGLPVNPADVVLSSTPNGPLAINPDGTVTVAPNTPAGTYTINYTICEVLNPTNCDTATATIVVAAPVIDALADTNAIPVNGTTGGNSGVNVLTNDTLNGLPVNPADIVLSSTPNGPLAINTDGTVTVAPNTPAGTYTINYTICEVLNPTNCDTATVTIVVVAPVIDALADTNAIPVNGTTGGNSGVNVLTNDTLNGLPVNPADVVLSATPNGPLAINPDGTVTVAPNTPAGTYTINYTICEVLNPTNCDTATVTIVVVAPVIDALADTNAIPVNGTTGGNSGVNVLTNDTLNGLPVNPADVVLSSTPNGPLAINPDGTVTVAPNTPAGTYTINYTICEVLNPTNCDTATATIVVAAPVIDALAETNAIPLNGTTGGNSGVNVLTNDTLNGLPVNPADVVLSSTPNGPLAINPDGTVTVAPNTPAGTYTINYTICEVLNPTNCDTATVTIVVAAPVIDALADTNAIPVNGTTGGNSGVNVLTNDTLNGLPVNPADVVLSATPNGPLAINPDGTVTVAPNTPAGTYTINYTICEVLNPTNCDTATVTIVVVAPVIDALADTNAIPVNGTTGGNSGVNVLTNDTLNGLPVNPADVVISSTPNGPLAINPDGTVTVAPNTPAGTYTINYTICEVLNPTNCDTATVTIVVAAPAIDALADTYSNINCTSFGVIGNVLANDTLNGNPTKSQEVNISLVSGENPNITLDNLGNINVQSGIVSGSYVLTYQICEKLNPTNCDTATITINVQDKTAPIIAQLPVASTISCGLTPNFTPALATDTCGSVNLTFVDVTVQGSCVGSYTITRTWTATDLSGNTSTASQVITVQDTAGPTTTTAFTAIANVNCDAIPAKPELVFVDNCSTVSPAIFTENITNRTENSYSIVRKWSVSDACGNASEFTQTINVSIANSIVLINSSICNDGEITTTNLNDFLPMGTPTNGTWVDVNNSGGLQGNILNASGISVRDYTFEYKIDDVTCPRTVRVVMTVNTGCGGIVLACGTILVHNAISPNGDGINEKFIIDNIDDTVCYPDNTVEIYNRWGVLVFETKGYNNTSNVFDGTSQGRTTISQPTGLPTGTYFYILNYTSVANDGKIITNKKDGYLYIVNN
ncbi:gliding motility-associated C-terminal domain-containing protein, partial [Flavobacterium sp. XS1P27]|uniref:T9SS type B sorting domain-containing protein n=1 Tax=Flavobacterium sp. XS1P27 TaxID=3401724 RepID=UPI003AABC502